MSKENKTLDKHENGNDFISDVGRSFTEEEIREQARKFCEKWLPKWEKHCDVCKACNCKNNDTCIECGCQF